MKKLSKLIYLVTLTLIITSCADTKKEELIGSWDDNIKLSTKIVEFDARQNSITITTEGDSWWLSDVQVNDEVYFLPEDINRLSESYFFKKDCFIIEKKDNNTLYIEIDENLSNSERTIIIWVQAGNYFDHIIIKQSTD